jgi:transcription-repair coupling factor (superfamily II helicase)
MMEFDEEDKRLMLRKSSGGQAYIVPDRVRDIAEFAEPPGGPAPAAACGLPMDKCPASWRRHGRISGEKFDVLVCTKIIESGLDIPNVNTILIDRADRFGWRNSISWSVGRSNVQAYAYLITPRWPRCRMMLFSDLKQCGNYRSLRIQLAMRDLEIRGAGNLLGSEQSGFIESMGFETYTRILEEAVSELKEEEFKGLYDQPARISIDNTILDVEVDAFIPQEYVSGDEERLEMYRRLYTVTSEEQIIEIELELKDRFGALPREVIHLFKILRLRLEATRHGFRKIKASGKSVQIEFPPRTDESFYHGDRFDAFLARISVLSGDAFHLSETPAGLSLRMVPDPNLEILVATLSCLRTAVSYMGPLATLPIP